MVVETVKVVPYMQVCGRQPKGLKHFSALHLIVIMQGQNAVFRDTQANIMIVEYPEKVLLVINHNAHGIP